MSASSSGTLRVLTKSWRRSATRQPSALVRPGRAGTSTSGMPSSRASATACSGPAPPKANSVKSRGSRPRASDTMRMAPAMCVLPSRITAAAASSTSMPSGSASFCAEHLAHLRHRHRPRHGEQPLGVEPAQHQVGVGDGGLGAAAAVADGAGLGARRLRPDLQHARRIDGCNRAAAGADALHVHHRHVDRQAVGDGDLGGHLRHAAVDQRHVGRRAAHVVGDGVGHARLRQGRRRRHHARRRPRHDGLGRLARHQPRRHRAAVAVHDEEVALEAAGPPARPAAAARSGRGSAARPR